MPTATPTDARLVAKTLTGAPAPFEALVERYFPAVFSIAYARTNNHADAEDVAQETFIRAYAKLNTLREPAKFGGWVASIARRTALNFRRAEHPANDTIAATLPAPATPEETAARNELHGLLRESITHLDESHREVLLLHYFAGMKTREIGELLELSQAAVLKRLQRAREALGTTLLEDARDTFEPTSRMKAQSKTIALAATASAPAWLGAGAAQAATAGGFFTAAKIAALVLVGASAVFLTSRQWTSPAADANAPTTFQSAPASIAESQASTMDRAIDIALPPPPPSSPIVLAANPGDPIMQDTSSVAGVLSLDEALNGPWSYAVYVVIEDARQLMTPNPVIVNFAYAAPELTITPVETKYLEDNPFIAATGRGSIVGADITLTYFIGGEDNPEGEEFELTGVIAPPYEHFTLAGSVLPNGSPDSPVTHVELEFKRATETSLADAALKDEYYAEAQAILDAIFEWADRHGGTLPESLQQLFADPYAHLFEDKDGRRIQYTPLVLDVGLSLKHDFPGFEPGLALDERLRAWEAHLASLWDGAFVPKNPLLRVAYAEPAISFATRGRDPHTIDVEINDETALPPAEDPAIRREQNAARRASCQNNMKQLGLVCKMFQQEWEDHIPGGWHTAYPEYLANRQVLTCPSSEENVISYELIYPARDEAFYAGVAEAATGEADPSVVPLAIEAHECSQSDGRNVLFHDGHVEFIAEDAMEDRVGRFLGYE